MFSALVVSGDELMITTLFVGGCKCITATASTRNSYTRFFLYFEHPLCHFLDSYFFNIFGYSFPMLFAVLTIRCQLKIFNPVISPYPILVMDVFIWGEIPFQMIFHHETVFQDVPEPDVRKGMIWTMNDDISASIDDGVAPRVCAPSYVLVEVHDSFLPGMSFPSFILT